MGSAETIDRMIECLKAVKVLRRGVGALRFPDDLERIFETQMRAARIADLRFTLSLAIFLYFISMPTDFVFVPDIVWTAMVVRGVFALPMIVLTLLLPALSNRSAELFVTLMFIVVVAVFSVIPACSRAPDAQFCYVIVMLGINFVTMVIPLRFHHSCLFVGVTGLVSILLILTHPSIKLPLGSAMTLLFAITVFFSLMANYRLEYGARLNYLLAARDRLSASALKRLSRTDGLTGLANRGYFDNRLRGLFADAADGSVMASLLLLDIDHFKRYNDHYGHLAGDRCLRAVAEAILDNVRWSDGVTARFGGEEFAVLLRGLDAGGALAVGERIRAAVEAQGLAHLNRTDGYAVVTISVGVGTMVSNQAMNEEDLIDHADRALYAAKHAGRNQAAMSDLAVVA